MTGKDVYLYGMTLLTTSHRLDGDYPEPDNYCEIAESHRLPGGETGTCAVVLGSLGLSVEIDGNYQGYDTYPELLSFFESTPISLDLVTCDPDFEGLEDVVLVDRKSRTCFGRFVAFYADKSLRRWNPGNEEAIRTSKVAGVDPFFYDESVGVARLCQQHGVKFATIDCKADSEMHALSEVNVVSDEFLRGNYPEHEIDALFSEYTDRTKGLVIFTFGAKELWFGRKGQDVQRFKPFEVEIASTLGAGDSFKAGVIYAMSKGMDDASLVRMASATAAAACMHYPIAANPPTLDRISRIAGESFTLAPPERTKD